MHAATALVRVAGCQLFFRRHNVQTMFDSLSASDVVCFAVVAQNMYFEVKHVPTHMLGYEI